MKYLRPAYLTLSGLLFFGLGSLSVQASPEAVSEWSRPSINSSCVSLKGDGWVYCFGGRSINSVTKSVTVFDPILDRPGYFADTFPVNFYAGSCAADSRNGQVYCFGGYYHDSKKGLMMHDAIFKTDLSVDGRKKHQKIRQTLPAPTAGLSCVEVSKERKIYCFGGHVTDGKKTTRNLPLVKNEGGQAFANYAFSFDLDTRKVTVIRTTKNIAADDLSCVYTSSRQRVYCFGGDQGSYKTFVKDGKVVKESLKAERDTIFSFDPKSGQFVLLQARLPDPISVLSCAPSGQKIYCFGGTKELRFGSAGDLNSRQIVVFDPARESVSVSSDVLPYPMAGHSCVESPLVDGAIYCFGGTLLRSGNSAVVKYTPG